MGPGDGERLGRIPKTCRSALFHSLARLAHSPIRSAMQRTSPGQVKSTGRMNGGPLGLNDLRVTTPLRGLLIHTNMIQYQWELVQSVRPRWVMENSEEWTSETYPGVHMPLGESCVARTSKLMQSYSLL